MSDQFLYVRTQVRSQALQVLFQAEATNRTVPEVLSGNYALTEGPVDDFGNVPLDDFADTLSRGCDAMRDDLDLVIEGASQNWGISRMSSVDRNLLRLAVYEMLKVDEVEIPVTINETVELAKAFGTDDSARFVNGVLGRVARDLDEGIDVVAAGRERAAAEAAAAEQARLAAEAAAEQARIEAEQAAAEAEAAAAAESEAGESSESVEAADASEPVEASEPAEAETSEQDGE